MRDVRRWWHQPSASIVAPKARLTTTSYQPHRRVRLGRTGLHRLSRGDTRAADGITYITATNAGSGEYQRLTLSYQYRWGDHEFWLHTSHSENLTSSRSYDSSVDAVPEDEIVAYVSGASINSRIDLISLDDLGRLNDDFSRPVTANLSIHSQWTDAFKTSFNVSYQGAYTSAVDTGVTNGVKLIH